MFGLCLVILTSELWWQLFEEAEDVRWLYRALSGRRQCDAKICAALLDLRSFSELQKPVLVLDESEPFMCLVDSARAVVWVNGTKSYRAAHGG